jgi:hypothetical protein
MEIGLAGLLFILFLIGLAYGSFKAFQRNWLAALLLLLFFMPGLMIWAIFEWFTGPVVRQPIDVRIVDPDE